MKQYTFALVALPLFAAIFFTQCSPASKMMQNNVLTNSEKKEGWKMLFNGNTEGWHIFNKKAMALVGKWTVMLSF